jgi:hypothetical protein
MIDAVLAKIFSTKNERETRHCSPVVAVINDFERRLKPFLALS